MAKTTAPDGLAGGREDQPGRKDWEQRYGGDGRTPREAKTISGLPLKPLYDPSDLAPRHFEEKQRYPGEFPYTRGVYPSMYRDKLWTMRQFAGFGSARDTNERYKYLLAQGQDGLSVAFDMPTLMGRDSDDPHSAGEVGRCGVAVDSLRDMELLFDGINVGDVTTSMTINSPAPILFAMYLAVAEKQGVPRERLGGTIQNDILKEYIAQKEYLYPPAPSMRLAVDVIEYCTENIPRWHPVSISGYHIREAGSDAVQELAFTLADGFEYVRATVERGIHVDSFAPRLSFFFDSHIDFFEEIAKFRAARRIWATVMRDRFGATKEKSLLMRFHTQTAGVSLTAQQPLNNVTRTALEALAAVLGGTQSLHTNALDEVLALPTQKAAEVALRTQQIIGFETGAASVIDPLGGSYYVEALTDEMERRANEYFERIDELGGVIPAIENGFFQREIAEASYRFEQRLNNNDRVIVGVNAFEGAGDDDIEVLKITAEMEEEQAERLAEVKRERDGRAVARTLGDLEAAARRDGENLIPTILEAVKVYATEGEIVDTLRQVFGEYRENAIF
ncbi:MAG: methylmalonyl-CoA mutase, N-terminal domain [Chloroflexota bacterium]|jgi:methylmalonyl-CoA mutase N-terminal domain/subunit|nr:methylmalonyl-CoA mutase, N-terminal domain [Chloroflexota bacterium]